jgi:uncharacterized protein (UPF0335 family)
MEVNVNCDQIETVTLNLNQQSTLREIVANINRLLDDKDRVSTDIQDVYAEAKSEGFDTKAIREVIKQIRKPRDEEQESIIDLYLGTVLTSNTESAK